MPSSDFSYRADIDGLRAVAVLPVVFYHAGFSAFSGGFVGVDVFFVISGYLITSIIAGEIQEGTFTLHRFYERRARRLFPALFTVIGACCLAAVFLLMPKEMEDFGQSAATTALFASNFLFFTEAGYFDGPAELKPLLHTWSLAIEEQYYLLFPGFLLLIKRRLRGLFLPWTLAVLLASFAISMWSVNNARDAAFYLLPSRTWELLLGSCIALMPAPALPQWLREGAGIAGVVLILTAVFTFDSSTPFPGAAALLPCLGTGLIIACGRNGKTTLAMHALSLRPVVFVGLISYSLYLWHWPVLVFARHYVLEPLSAYQASVLVMLSILLAIGSWRFVERPFRGSRGLLSRRGIFAASAAVMTLAIGTGLYFDSTEGAPHRLPPKVQRIAEVANDKPPERIRCEGMDPADITYDTACRLTSVDAEPSVLVWGDSHAMAIMPVMSRAAATSNLNGLNITSNGCVPILGVSRPGGDQGNECVDFNETVLNILAEHPNLRTVIIVARWARHSEGTVFGDEDGDDLFIAYQGTEAATPQQNRGLFRTALANTLQRLEQLGRRIVIVGPVPEIGTNVPVVLAKATWRNKPIDLDVPVGEFEARQAFIHDTFAELQQQFDIHFLDPAPYFCDATSCDAVDSTGLPLYFDDNHIASAGGARIQPLVDGLFANIIGP